MIISRGKKKVKCNIQICHSKIINDIYIYIYIYINTIIKHRQD